MSKSHFGSLIAEIDSNIETHISRFLKAAHHRGPVFNPKSTFKQRCGDSVFSKEEERESRTYKDFVDTRKQQKIWENMVQHEIKITKKVFGRAHRVYNQIDKLESDAIDRYIEKMEGL